MRSRRPLDASSIKSTSQYYSYFAACLVRRELVALAEPFTECCIGRPPPRRATFPIPNPERRCCWLWPPRPSRSVGFRRLWLGKLLNRSRVCVPLSLRSPRTRSRSTTCEATNDATACRSTPSSGLSICFVPIPNASCSSASDESNPELPLPPASAPNPTSTSVPLTAQIKDQTPTFEFLLRIRASSMQVQLDFERVPAIAPAHTVQLGAWRASANCVHQNLAGKGSFVTPYDVTYSCTCRRRCARARCGHCSQDVIRTVREHQRRPHTSFPN
jgi:hypothetical protein